MGKRYARSSNFELLRILAMLMIVISHIAVHCVNVQLADPASIEKMNNGLFCNPVFYKKLLIIMSVMPFGKMGNVIFLLISGYFMITKINSIDLGKIAGKLLMQLVFANTMLVILSNICYHLLKDTYIGMITIGNVNSQSWFIGYYFLIMMAAALFLNSFLSGLTEKQFRAYLLTLFAVFTFGWSGSLLNNLADSLRVFAAGVFVYSFGAYVRLYNPLKRVRSGVLVFACVLVYGLMYFSYYNTTVFNIEKYYLKGSAETFYQTIVTFTDYSPIPIILGICIFELFRRIRIPVNRIINYLGSTTFMVYLLHDNAFAYSIYNIKDWITLLYFHPIVFVLHLMLWGICVFAFCVVMNLLYNTLGRLAKAFRRVAICDADQS